MYIFVIAPTNPDDQVNERNFDYYDSAVVVAETADQARLMHPCDDAEDYRFQVEEYWVPRDQVTVTLIGNALSQTIPHVVCASYNAG